MTSKRQASDKQATTNKNVKNAKNEKEKVYRQFNHLSMTDFVYPQIGINPVTTWFVDTMHFISNIKYLGWIISFIAFLNALNIIFMGFASLIGLLTLLKEYITHSENEAS